MTSIPGGAGNPWASTFVGGEGCPHLSNAAYNSCALSSSPRLDILLCLRARTPRTKYHSTKPAGSEVYGMMQRTLGSAAAAAAYRTPPFFSPRYLPPGPTNGHSGRGWSSSGGCWKVAACRHYRKSLRSSWQRPEASPRDCGFVRRLPSGGRTPPRDRQQAKKS